MNEITVIVNGAVQWRFNPHGFEVDAVVTQRIPQYPPVPVGAELLQDGEPLGTARCVQRRQFNRWAIVYDPVDGRQQTVDGETETVEERISREIFTTPIEALRDHMDPRLFGTVEQLADNVEDLIAKTDEALRAIDGIGPKRLLDIRAACDEVLGEE